MLMMTGRISLTVSVWVCAKLLPKSSSKTVTMMVLISEPVPVGLSSRNWWETRKARDLKRSGIVSDALPSPQLMYREWVSKVPGSMNVPERLTDLFSLIEEGVAVWQVIPVTTFFTVTLVEPLVLPVSSSVTVAPIVQRQLLFPTHLPARDF